MAESNLDWIKNLTFDDLEIPGDFKTFINDISYVGFDPKALMTQIFKAGNDASLNTDQIKLDLQAMAGVGQNRGNMRLDTLDKTSATGRQQIEKLIQTYNIKLKPNKNTPIKLEKITITFSRVMMICPMHVGKMLWKGVITPTSLWKERFGVESLPKAMQVACFSSFLSCLENALPQEGLAIKLAGLAWSFCFNLTINEKARASPDWDAVVKYFELGESFTLNTSANMMQMLNKVGIYSQSGVHQSIKATAVSFALAFPMYADGFTSTSVRVDGTLENIEKSGRITH
jgi:hypothetical protein